MISSKNRGDKKNKLKPPSRYVPEMRKKSLTKLAFEGRYNLTKQ